MNDVSRLTEPSCDLIPNCHAADSQLSRMTFPIIPV